MRFFIDTANVDEIRGNAAWRGNDVVFSRVLEDHRYLGAVF